MGDMRHGVGSEMGIRLPEESVTGVGGPVLLRTTAPELERGDVLAARYQIEAVIGTGGSGRVLRAFDRVARELVALKILRAEYMTDPVWTERFSRELRVGRQIQHRNVCRIFDIGDADGHRFLSMELATRGTIRGQIGPAAVGRPLEDRIADARAVVEGVAALHAAGIVHRDIKPENLLRMEDGRLVVSDFGLATDPGAGPATTIMVGTPRYMAPEVVMGDPATTRSDVWALGTVLHEILFGTRPDRSVVRRGVRHFTPPQVTSLKERRLAELCGRCGDDDAEARPASAAEVCREFEAAVLGRRLRRPADRQQMFWGAVALAGLVALGVVRDQWASQAVASSSPGVTSGARVIQGTGTPEDWSKNSTKFATFEGKLHCFSAIDGAEKVRAIWGSPRRAEDIDARSGARVTATLLPETYVDGCPQLAPNRNSLLFSKATDSGTFVFLSPYPDGRGAKQVVRGTSPKWLPNGEEFVFSADSRHAAIFSIPTGDMTLVTDGEDGSRQLGEYEIDSTGKRLAVLYATDATYAQVVVHSLPGLQVIGRVHLPPLSERLQFGTGGVLSFVMDGPGGFGQMMALDFRDAAGEIRPLGQLTSADVLGVLEGTGARVVADHRLSRDLWVQTSGGAERLTWDGNSVHGAMSVDGQIVLQRRLPDGRRVMVLRNHERGETQMTEGPLDATPMFLPDGKSWLYSRLNLGQISECVGDTRVCRVVHSDSLVPGFPVPDPTGQQIAYLTLMNVPRIRVVSKTGHKQRDFGPAGGDACSPIWTSTTRLWVAQAASGSQMTWAEIDTVSGARSGAKLSSTLAKGRECAIPSELTPARSSGSPSVFSVSEEKSELRRTVAAAGMI